jgi:hypothetical protein
MIPESRKHAAGQSPDSCPELAATNPPKTPEVYILKRH